MRLLKLSALVLASVVGITGCSVKEATPVVHQPPVETKPTTSVPSRESESVGAQSVSDLGKTNYGAILDKARTAGEIYNKVVLPLSRILLNPEIYQNRTAVSSRDFFVALRDFNTALLRLSELDADLLNSSGVLKDYDKAIFVDCSLELKGTCSNVNVYAREAHFPRILVLLAKQEKDVLKYYRNLYAAFERGRPETDQEMNYLYLDRHQELARLYISQTEDGATSEVAVKIPQADLEALRMHARTLQNILADFDPDQVGKDKMGGLVKQFNPWDVSRRTSGLSAIGIDKILNWAAKGYLYQDANRTVLAKSFTDRVNAILEGDNESYGLGIKTIQSGIKQGHSGGILKNFSLDRNIEADEYIYLVDRIFYGHFDVQDAATFWSYTRKDQKKLFEALSIFVRLQIANMIVWTNSQMSLFFEQKSESYKDLIQLLRGAVNNSLQMHAKWDRALSRIERLINFADREYGKVDPFNLPDDDPYKQFSNSISGLRHNIKMLSVYPNMMMIVYLMAKKDFNATIMTFFGPMTITSYEVINWFFIRVMSPWFNFGTNSTSLTQVELLYALHFSLATELFSTFKNNPVIPVNEAEFFSEVTEKLVNDQYLSMQDKSKAMAQFKQSNAKLLREALSACTEERTLQPLEEADGVMRSRKYARVFSYEEINSRFANGGPGTRESQLGTLVGFFSSQTGIEASVESILTSNEFRMLFVRNMLGIFKNYLKEVGKDTSALDEAYQKQVERFFNERNAYLKSVYEQFKQYGDCSIVLYKREKALRNKLFTLEEEYLGSVYDRVAELNSLFKSGSVELAKTKADQYNSEMRPSDNGLPKDYIDRGGYDKYVLNSEGYYYNYHKFDALLRVRRSLRQLTPNTEVTLPNFDKLAEYQQPTPKVLIIAENVAQDALRGTFIADGMKQFLGFMNATTSFTPTFLLERIDVLSRLYRLGSVAQDGSRGCDGADCYRVTAEDVIREALNAVKMSDISEFDEKIMAWTGTDKIYDDNYWARLAIEQGNRRHLGILDLTFQRVICDSSKIASLHGPVTTFFLDLTKKYYDTEMSVGNFFFEPRENVKSQIKSNYAGYVNDYETKVNQFLEAYERLRKDPSLRIEGVRRSLTDKITVSFKRDENGEDIPVYITEERKNRYLGAINIFHEGTSGEFKTNKP